MKIQTFLLVTISTLALTFGYSQTEKGSMLLGGTFNLSNSSIGDDNVLNVGLSPDIGFFVIDKLSVGGSLGLSLQSTESTTQSTFSIVPELRYYFPPLTETISLFATGGVGYITTRTNFDIGSVANETDSGYRTNLGVGLAFFLTENVALEGIFGHGFLKFGDDTNGVSNLGLNGGVQVYLSR